MFTIEEIEKIAELASLELTDEEKRQFARQFEDILNYFTVIDAAPVSAETEAAPARSGPLFREDVAADSGISPKDFSPYLEAGHFKVPKVIE
jgi:aspartyl/glutamyl-tRNA(Asn/Gln) amidotransferase C subunit